MENVPPLDSTRQLFVDGAVLEESDGLVKIQHRMEKHPDNPILGIDRPWEADSVSLYGSVWRDPDMGLLRMWYRTGHRLGEKDWRNNTLICHAVSVDGVRWEKPDTAVFDYWGSYHNNIVFRPHYLSDTECGRFDSMNVMQDLGDPDPQRRYKMMSFQYAVPDKYVAKQKWPSGYYPAYSADGLHWREDVKPILNFVTGGYGDTLTLMHDTRRDRYVCFCKILSPEHGTRMSYQDEGDGTKVWDGKQWIPFESENPVKRFRGMLESKDFAIWSEPRFILPKDDRDPPDVQFYNNSGFVYESMYLGFLDIYHVDTTGTIDVQLIHSRDGDSWRRSFDRSPILSNGRELSDWDYGCHAMAGNPPIRMGDKLYVYYSSSSIRHSGGNLEIPRPPGNRRLIGLATLRLDGFVSLDAKGHTGSALTKPFVLCGSKLAVNADCSRGQLKAEILSKGKQIPGYDEGACEPVRRDGTRILLNWKGGPLHQDDGPVQIRFLLNDASLYSFWCES